MHFYLKNNRFYNFRIGRVFNRNNHNWRKNLIFTPTEKFNKDHDIKILKIDFNSDLSGIGTQAVGQVDLVGSNVGVDSTSSGVTTTTIAQFPNTDFNGLFASVLFKIVLLKKLIIMKLL